MPAARRLVSVEIRNAGKFEEITGRRRNTQRAWLDQLLLGATIRRISSMMAAKTAR
jgi:hypothetical protein